MKKNEKVTYILYLTSGSYYVGSSCEFDKRLKRHLYELERGIHHCAPMQSEWNRGERLDRLATITSDSEDGIREMEQALLDQFSQFPHLLNVGKGSVGGDNLSRNPNKDSIVERISTSIKERMERLTDEEKRSKFGQPGERNPMFGKTHTEEARRIMSDANKGKHHGLGRKLSAEHVAKISERAKLRTGSQNPFFGKTHSSETRAILAAKNAGRKPPNMRKVQIGDQVYDSVSDAAKANGIGSALVLFRIKSKNPRFSDYEYV